MNVPHYAATESFVEKAGLYLRERRLQDALDCFGSAEADGADFDRCSGGRWFAHMLLGNFEAAWVESDAIRTRGAPDPHRFWNGEPLEGRRVILRCLHGFGDAVHFFQYLPLLGRAVSSVIIEVHPRFAELARCFQGAHEVITWGENAPAKQPPWDAQIEIMELPHIFRTQVRDLPIASRYLQLNDDSRPPRNQRLQVGLMWTVGSWNPARSVPFAMLRCLLAVKGCEFWDLSETPNQALHQDGVALKQDERCRNSIAGLAATIARMDLVITVDTVAAHLAGAMGRPVWIMLQHEADWRWMHGRDDSPWYPSARLFRQQTQGDWRGVIQRVQIALETHRPKRREVVREP